MTSTTMELLPLLCLCVLTWSGTTSADVQGPEIINVTEGSDVTLPCSITGNIELRRFDWKKDGQKEVYVFDSGLSSSQGLSGNDEQFKGRVSHFSGELKNGNASIMIRNTKVADSGNYTCEFQHLPNQKFLMKLLVGECFHHTADYLQMRLVEESHMDFHQIVRIHIWQDLVPTALQSHLD